MSKTDPRKHVLQQKLSIDTTHIITKQRKITTYYKVMYLYGVKQISKQTMTCKPNRGQTPIILTSTTLVKTYLKHLFTKVKRTHMNLNNSISCRHMK